MEEWNILCIFFFFSQLKFFTEPWKQIENPAKYELFLPKPLTLTLFWWRL